MVFPWSITNLINDNKFILWELIFAVATKQSFQLELIFANFAQIFKKQIIIFLNLLMVCVFYQYGSLCIFYCLHYPSFLIRFLEALKHAGFTDIEDAALHVLLFVSALIPKALSSLLTSLIIETNGKSKVFYDVNHTSHTPM